MIADYYRSRI